MALAVIALYVPVGLQPMHLRAIVYVGDNIIILMFVTVCSDSHNHHSGRPGPREEHFSPQPNPSVKWVPCLVLWSKALHWLCLYSGRHSQGALCLCSRRGCIAQAHCGPQ